VSESTPQPEKGSTAGRNHKAVLVDLRRGGRRDARELPSQAELRDAVQAARQQQRAAGITIGSSRP
jgi:hypothetical protein